MSEDQACEVPLVEQLRSIPEGYRTVRAIQWSDDGRETGHQYIPVGVMMHRAAAEIERLQSARPEVACIPEGWKMVPLEPTLEMKEAAAMYRASCEDTRLQKTFGGYYRAMLAAAPSVPSPQPQRTEKP